MANDPRFEVYPLTRDRKPGEWDRDADLRTGEFGWRFRAANGQISAVGGEGFTRREDAHRAVEDFLRAVAVATTGHPGAEADGTPPIIDLDDAREP